ncbi:MULTISPECIES: ATP-binding protein [unclassified Beijerinckia]|uniref:ATP-binding protein n=1 Tax=unclassified Beijerinckia TaxID=2638183 RepID=UPI001FCCC392|nr:MULTISPECIES: ATP-binding protein [unclassified Beijerinckia]
MVVSVFVVGVLGVLAALLGAAVGWAIHAALSRRKPPDKSLDEARFEKLQDELWALKEAAAARHRAEAANEAKSRFLATVSHEIRTPLNGILGMADLLRHGPLVAEQRAYVEAIHTSGTALANLIEEILDFSRIEAGRLELANEPFDIVTLVEGVTELLAPRAQDKGVGIAAVIETDVPRRLIGDAARLRQVLINLAGNAVKFTETGGVGIRVAKKSGDRVIFSVADTGPGIGPDQQETIFEDFEQGDGSATRRHGGSGLGLAISRRIIDHMQGDLRLESTGSHGSVFTFDVDLPAASGQDKADTPPLWGRRVLIVGRAPFETSYLGERLAAVGAETLRAETIGEVRSVLAQKPAPDVAIIDCALGEDVLRQIAEATRVAGVERSLILFSPFERRATAQNTLAGFDGWLVKPVRTASLIARLRGEMAGSMPTNMVEPGAKPRLELNVLLVEDNEINALVARKHLERFGAKTIHAVDGIEAVDIVSRTLRGDRPRFDVILMDIRMPGLDGIDASRWIRRLEREAGVLPTRIVALTANAFEEDRRAALDAGIDDFLTKPIDPDHLQAAILPKRQMA